MEWHTHRSRSGQSLIEVSLAVAVLAFGLAGVVQLYCESQNSALRTRESLAAELMASRHAEELRAAGYRALLDYLSQHEQEGQRHVAFYPAEKAAAELQFGARRAVPCEWQAEIEQSPTIPGCLQAIVVVEWKDSGGGLRRAQQIAYVFE